MTTPLDVLRNYIHPSEPAWVAMMCSAVVATCGVVDCARKENKKMIENISHLDAKHLKEIRKEVKKCKLVSRNLINMNLISTCCLGREFILFPQAPCLFLAGVSCYVVLKSISLNKRAKMLRADSNFGGALSSLHQKDQVIYVSSMMKLAIIRNEIEQKLALRNQLNTRIQNEQRKLAKEEEISLTLTNIYRNSSDTSDVSCIRIYDVDDEITELKEEVREVCDEMLVTAAEVSQDAAAKSVAVRKGMSTGEHKRECLTPTYLPNVADYGDYDDFSLYDNTIYD